MLAISRYARMRWCSRMGMTSEKAEIFRQRIIPPCHAPFLPLCHACVHSSHTVFAFNVSEQASRRHRRQKSHRHTRCGCSVSFSVVSSGFTRFLCLQYKGRLSLRAVKFFLDGALGSRGAALLAPYSDAPAQRGQLRLTEANYSAAVAAWVKNGWQVGPPMPLEIPQ